MPIRRASSAWCAICPVGKVAVPLSQRGSAIRTGTASRPRRREGAPMPVLAIDAQPIGWSPLALPASARSRQRLIHGRQAAIICIHTAHAVGFRSHRNGQTLPVAFFLVFGRYFRSRSLTFEILRETSIKPNCWTSMHAGCRLPTAAAQRPPGNGRLEHAAQSPKITRDLPSENFARCGKTAASPSATLPGKQWRAGRTGAPKTGSVPR